MDEPKKKPPPPIPDSILVHSDGGGGGPNGHVAATVAYTSLRDLIPAVAPPSIMSPTHNASWHEIPIRNPLVKQAALSYLQPMSAPPEAGEKGICGNMRDLFCGSCGCFSWLSDAVSRRARWVLGDRVRGWIDEDDDDFDDDDDEEEDGGREKVD